MWLNIPSQVYSYKMISNSSYWILNFLRYKKLWSDINAFVGFFFLKISVDFICFWDRVSQWSPEWPHLICSRWLLTHGSFQLWSAKYWDYRCALVHWLSFLKMKMLICILFILQLTVLSSYYCSCNRLFLTL